MRDPKGPVKAYKSPQEIATQHKVPLAAVMKQVKMGTKVEGEHTTSKSGARITALQHVDELPDYYTKLKKVEKIKEGNLHQWFHGSSGVTKSGKRKPGWVQADGSPCANEPGETKTPKCFSSSKLASMSKSEVRSAVRRKREQDPGQQEKSGAAKPTYVPTDKPKKKMNEESDVKGKGSGTKDACYHKVKARFKVWPSAYASGALVKCRQAGAKNWGNKSEAANPAQQAAIAIAMKKAGKKPKGMKEEMTADAQYLKDTKYCLLCRKNEKRHECGYGPQMWDRYSIAKIHPTNEAANPAQQAAIAISMKKEGKKPKNMKEDHVAIAMGKMLDSEGGMIMSQLDQIEMAVAKLRKLVKDPQMQVPAWVQSKITMATDYIDTAADYMSSKDESFEMEEGMTMDDFITARKKRERSAARKELSPTRRAGIHNPEKAPERASRRDAAYGETGYGGSLRPKKERKARAVGELTKEEYIDEACWTGYKQVGMKKKGKKMVPNCVPANEDSCQSFSQFMQIAEVAAWQRKEGKNPSGGLNEKGRKSYERENPGSNLQAPQPEGGPRKRSFCARMGGMPGPMEDEKGRPTRKALALRKWKC